jgi:hypothetical protein
MNVYVHYSDVDNNNPQYLHVQRFSMVFMTCKPLWRHLDLYHCLENLQMRPEGVGKSCQNHQVAFFSNVQSVFAAHDIIFHQIT